MQVKKKLQTKIYKLKAEGGFTLIELMVSIAIVGILASIVAVNTRFGERQQALAQAAQKLVLDLRKAQNSALAPGAETDCIYGLKVASTADYFIYKRSDSDCQDGKKKYVNGSSTILERVYFNKSIKVNNWNSSLDISFEAPEPITYLNGTSTTASGEIVLKSTINNTTKKIVVNRFGLVEIQ